MIGFAGLSHLGIVMSLATAAKGFKVVAYDPSPELCKSLDEGQLPVVEPHLLALLAAARPYMSFSADASCVGRCELVFLSMDTPTGADNLSDVSALSDLIDTVARHAAPETVVVVLSQVPPGFTRRLARRWRREHGGRAVLYYQAETLVFGCAVERAMEPERFIVGCEDPGATLPMVYADLLGAWACPVLRMRYESAELAKIAINMFLASSVSVTNTLAELSEAIGAEWCEIVPALRLDRRIGPHAYLAPGLGLSGGNLERDLATVGQLSREYGTDAQIIEAWRTNSAHRESWVLKRLHAETLGFDGDPVIAIWGLAYKPNTASVRNSPAFNLVTALAQFPVRAYDPEVVLPAGAFPNVARASSAIDACRGAAALAVMTPWTEFSSVALSEVRNAMTGRVIVDPFGILDSSVATALGFSYSRLGSPVRDVRPDA